MRKLTPLEQIVLASIAAILILVFAIIYGSRQILEYLEVAGVLASLIGLILVLVQLRAVKDTTEITQRATADTQGRVLAFLTAMDIAKNLKTIQEIQIYNRAKKYELSIVRMQELRSSLTDILHDERLNIYIKPQAIQRHISDLSVNMTGLEKEVQAPSQNFDVVGLNKFLNSVSDSLDTIYSKTKHQGIAV